MFEYSDVYLELRQLSSKVGGDIRLTQGGGGNTSIKEGSSMWVKASGKWLANALKEDVFVEVNYRYILEQIELNNPNPEKNSEIKKNGLRPSIETTLHALLPFKIVVHVHSINAISWAILKNGKDFLTQKLKKHEWLWIDYHKPGLPLTLAIKNELKKKNANVLILANHGLVVCANTVSEAEGLLYEIEGDLSIRENNYLDIPQKTVLSKIEKLIPYNIKSAEPFHFIALNKNILSIAQKGVLYPDHVVFIGKKLAIIEQEEDPKLYMDKYKREFGFFPPVLFVKNVGILIYNEVSKGAIAMLWALSLVLKKWHIGNKIHYLDDVAVNELVNWEAEKYRQKIN